jgi:hypothetical protein
LSGSALAEVANIAAARRKGRGFDEQEGMVPLPKPTIVSAFAPRRLCASLSQFRKTAGNKPLNRRAEWGT